jgi:UDP-4-amino-4,6-dideoxy-N-acetyl-beta-L-altrosamine transaminase
LTQGPAVPKFEQSLASHVEAKHCVAVNSATSALHIACLALGLAPGDWLWTSPITFVASANCALYCGAKVDFVDIDPKTYNMCPLALAAKLDEAARDDKLPKIVVPVHFSGQPCDMAAIAVLAEKYGFKVIEDASHAVGGKYRNSYIGNCQYSDITIFSFHPVKIVTTAEGGATSTNSLYLAETMGRLRSHGITRDPVQMVGTPDGPWYYQQVQLGFNYRLTDLQAALGSSQLSRLNYYVNRRSELALRYDQMLNQLPLVIPHQSVDSYSAWHLYVVRIPIDIAKKSRSVVFEELRAKGIGVNVHYIPVHMQPHYQAMGFRSGDFPNAENYYAEAISLPLFPTMTLEDQGYVVNSLTEALSK